MGLIPGGVSGGAASSADWGGSRASPCRLCSASDDRHRECRLAITFEPADAHRAQAVLTELNVAYLDWLDANIRQDFGLALPSLLGQ